jgi:hypothetical protein
MSHVCFALIENQLDTYLFSAV